MDTGGQPSAAGRPVRVLFINDTTRNGGPGRSLLVTLTFLDPLLVHRAVVVPREGIVSGLLREAGVTEELVLEPRLIENVFEPWSRAMRREDFDAAAGLKAVRAVGNVMRGAAGLWALLRRVRRGRFDLVFCHGTTANFAGSAIAAFTGTPVLWHVFYPGVAPALHSLHARLAALRNVRSIVCVSRAVAGQFDHCRGKVRVIHDAIDLAEYDPRAIAPVLRRELALDERTVVFGSQGRILPRKGYVEMVRAARLVFDRLTAEERRLYRFVVLGDTPEDSPRNHLEECRGLVRELGLSDSFHFLGYRRDVKPYIRDFDVSVVPSIYQDPLPRAVLEAMALGKPVVAFDRGGITEMVDDGVSGTLVAGAPPDIGGLAAALLGYFRDPEMRRAHGEAGRRRIARDFEAVAHARAIQAEILRTARGPAPPVEVAACLKGC